MNSRSHHGAAFDRGNLRLLKPQVRPYAALVLVSFLALTRLAIAQYPTNSQVAKDRSAILLEDYATLPLSSRTKTTYPPPTDYADQLSRPNFLRSEPINAPLASTRFVVCDLNRNLYFLNRTNKTFTPYINFEEVFARFDNDPGFAGGLVTFAFDPEYATNGIFYTVHTETNNPFLSPLPRNAGLPGLDTNGYAISTVINPPTGNVLREAVLIEWRDTNVSDSTFEGTAREILRVGFTSNIHPMGDLLFHPLAQPGDWDYRNLYIGNGDGGAGESSATRTIPQRLDALQGKILRITPDLNLRTNDTFSPNGRYRIPSTGPDPNPFVSIGAARPEIFAYGFRNCHRLTWDTVANVLIENDIGLHSWEEVNIIHKGTNYGYSEREGVEQLFVCNSCGFTNGLTGSRVGVVFPTNSDTLTVTNLGTNITPVYPVATYSHRDGDAISSGFVYRGKLMPQFYGKYIFGDITTGRLFYSDLAEMIANDDSNRASLAAIHEIQVVFQNPHTNLPPATRRVFDIVKDEYHYRGGTATSLPGSAIVTSGNDPDGVPYGGGRSDIRLTVGDDGELYLISKSDGTIRRFAAALSPPILQCTATNGTVTLTWPSVPGWNYRVQYKPSLEATNWTDLPDDISATSLSASKRDAPDASRLYRVKVLP